MANPKFIFDECIGLPFYKVIVPVLELHTTNCTFEHVVEKHKPGVKDKDWIEKLTLDWVIITSDNGRKSKFNEKLPIICKQRSITAIRLSRKIHQQNQFYKAQTIISLWSEILKTADFPHGSQFKIEWNGESKKPSLKELS